MSGAAGFVPVPSELQQRETTLSRHVQPAAWRRGLAWLVGSGLHPRAGATTLRVADDLAARMDYVAGTVLYDLDGTAQRLGVDRATVKRHVAVIRELGGLVWVRRGSRRNLRLPGRKYAGTATIYAAVLPAVYDDAMGHRVEGSGFDARVVGVSDEWRAAKVGATRGAGRPVDNSPVDNCSWRGRAPHSLGATPLMQDVEVVGSANYTSHASRNKINSRRTGHPAAGSGCRRHPLQVARDVHIARQVRPRIPWVQREGLRRLAFALRPLIDRGLDAVQIAGELTGMCLTWRPASPASYLQKVLAQDADAEFAKQTAAEPSQPPTVAPFNASASQREEIIRGMQIGAQRYTTLARENRWAVGAQDTPPPESEQWLLPKCDELEDDLVQELLAGAVDDLGLVRGLAALAGEDYARTVYGEDLLTRATTEDSDQSRAAARGTLAP